MILSAQTTPSWSWDVVSSIATAAAALVAVAALVLSIVNYVQARETRVSWRVEREVSKSGVAYEVRLINESRRFAAVVQSVGDPVPVSEEDGGPLVDPQGIAFPAVVEPGNWIVVRAAQYLGHDKTRIKIVWHQRRANGRWVRPVKHVIVLYR